MTLFVINDRRQYLQWTIKQSIPYQDCALHWQPRAACRYMMACYVSHSSRICTLILMITGGVRHCCQWDGADLIGIRRVVSLDSLPIWIQNKLQQIKWRCTIVNITGTTNSLPVHLRMQCIIDYRLELQVVITSYSTLEAHYTKC
jgi:hypothetical protein